MCATTVAAAAAAAAHHQMHNHQQTENRQPRQVHSIRIVENNEAAFSSGI